MDSTTLTNHELLAHVAALLPRNDFGEITPGTHLFDEAGLDSLDLLELLGRIEDDLGVEIPPPEGVRMRTVGELVAGIEAHLSRRTS